MQRPNGARWAIALALGLRQGEVAGLRWADVDLETRSLRIQGMRPRPVYGHGCGGRCGRKAGFCPRRHRLNPEVGDAKSQAGRRVVGFPEELVQLLVAHRSAQTSRGEGWQPPQEGGWGFASAMGSPLSLKSHYRDWKALLRAAGVPDGRLHDARHTAATVLLVLGVPERTVMSVMGWSSTAMAARYQHVTTRFVVMWPTESAACCRRSQRVSTMPIETIIETRPGLLRGRKGPPGVFPGGSGGGCGIRTRTLAPNPLSKSASLASLVVPPGVRGAGEPGVPASGADGGEGRQLRPELRPAPAPAVIPAPGCKWDSVDPKRGQSALTRTWLERVDESSVAALLYFAAVRRGVLRALVGRLTRPPVTGKCSPAGSLSRGPQTPR